MGSTAEPAANADRWPLWVLLGLVASLGCFEANDGDIGFHLATGREILRALAIPSRNVLSYTEPEHPWLLHQGLPALLFEWTWQRMGWLGLMGVKLLALVGTWSFVFAAARALRAAPVWAAGCCLLAASASAFRFELRPFLFTHLTLACVVWVICRAVGDPSRWTDFGAHRRCALVCETDFGARRTCALCGVAARRTCALCGVAAVAICLGWQLHAGAIDSVLVLTIFALGVAVEPLRARFLRSPDCEPSGLRASAPFGAAVFGGMLAAALCLLTYQPNGLSVLAVPFQIATHPYWASHSIEIRPPWQLPLSQLWAYWAWLSCVIAALACGFRTLHTGLMAVVVAYALLSLLYARMAYAFAIVSVPPVALTVERLWRERAQSRRAAPAWYAPFALLCMALSAMLYVYSDHRLGIGISQWVWPSEHFAFVRKQALKGNAFVSDAWAGAFLGEFYPERRVFFDPRLEAYSDALAIESYQRIRYGRPGWDTLLDRHEVQFLLLRYTTPSEAKVQGATLNLRQRLVDDPRYALVYFDDVGELFVRRGGPNAQLAAQMAIEGVDPDRHAFLQQPSAAAPALLRAVERGMRSQTVLGLLSIALADAGQLSHAQSLAAALLANAPEDAFAQRVARAVHAPAQVDDSHSP